MGDDPKEGDETANNTSVEEAPVEGEVPAEGDAKDDAPAEDKEPVEEEIKTLTLDEWKAQQKKEAPKFNLRKAGEGSDIDPKWKKATILHQRVSSGSSHHRCCCYKWWSIKGSPLLLIQCA